MWWPGSIAGTKVGKQPLKIRQQKRPKVRMCFCQCCSYLELIGYRDPQNLASNVQHMNEAFKHYPALWGICSDLDGTHHQQVYNMQQAQNTTCRTLTPVSHPWQKVASDRKGSFGKNDNPYLYSSTYLPFNSLRKWLQPIRNSNGTKTQNCLCPNNFCQN